MNKLIIVLVVLAVVGVGAYYLLSNNGSSGTSTYSPVPTNTVATNTPVPITETPIPTTTTPKTSTSKTPTPSSVTVNIANFAFNPSTLTIKKGTRVTWTNNDTAPHTVTSDSGNLLNSATLALGQSFSITFTSVGTTNYHCAIHPMMKGVVVVTN